MDFVDPSQRHCLEDSDEEDDSFIPNNEAFTFPNGTDKLEAGSNLIIAVGQPASIFAKGYLSLDPLPSCTISTEFLTLFKDRHFTSPAQHSNSVVSEGFGVECKELEHFYLCTHEKQLNSQYCTLWCNKVNSIALR